MNRHQTLVTGGIVGAGLLLALLIILAPSASAPADEQGHGDPHAEGEEASHGPHGGDLLEPIGERTLEVTIFETGVPPEFRIYPLEDGRPVDPDRLILIATVQRLGGIVDTVRFTPAGAFLRGDAEVTEPHSFDVMFSGTWDGEPVRWSHSTVEGRVEMPDAVAEANGVVLETAGPAPIRSVLDLPGEVQLNADRVARVAPRVSGTVVAVTAGLGERVGVGSALLVIESRELGEAQRAYVESLHRLELAQKTYERERHLHERRISATREYEQARHDLEEAEIDKQAAEQTLHALGVSPAQLESLGVEPEGPVEGQRIVRDPLPNVLTRYAVRSPVNGEVIARDVSVGQHVNGTEEAVVVADLSEVWVEVTVYARDLDVVRPGQEVFVHVRGDSLTGPSARGQVHYVGPLVGEATRTARALVTLPNDGRWRPGMFVSAEVVQDEETVPVAVRREAIQTWRGMPVVFARFGEHFEVRPVVLGRASGAYVEVRDGLESGTPYAARGSYLLRADLEKSSAAHHH